MSETTQGETVCTWMEEEGGVYSTYCGNHFYFVVGTPEENEFHFCPYCGHGLIDDTPAAHGQAA